MAGDVRPDRHCLLELEALLAQVTSLVVEGDWVRYQREPRYRWLLHRLWIAAGNEAHTFCLLAGLSANRDEPWSRVYRLRNVLAHRRLSDIDEADVWSACVDQPVAAGRLVRSLLR